MPTALDIAQYGNGVGDHMDDGWGVGMIVMMVLFAVVIGACIFWVVRSTTATTIAVPQESPKEILERRLAQGDIAPEEYRDRVATLAGS